LCRSHVGEDWKGVTSPDVPVGKHSETKTNIITGVSLSLNAVRALGYFLRVVVGFVDVSEEYAAPFFRVDVNRVSECCVMLRRLAVKRTLGPVGPLTYGTSVTDFCNYLC
jgi:hypothetical protein